MRNLLLLLVLLVFSEVNSKHIAGGDFYSTWIGGNNFKLTLKLYRDCTDPTGSPFDASITIGIFNKATNVLVSSHEVYRGQVIDLVLAGDLCSPPPDVCMEQGTYEVTVNLPNNSAGYYCVWERCCRNASIVNLSNASGAAMAFYHEIPNPALQNSSPVFLNDPLPYMCINQPWTYNFNATDPDGDSIYIYLSTPLDGGHTSNLNPNPFSLAVPTGGGGQTPLPGPYPTVTWAPGYNQFNVIAGSPTLSINSATGQMTCTPNSLGFYAMAVVVDEFRNGVLIGRVRRELEFYVITCSQNALPTVSATQAPNNFNNYEVYAGDTINFNINISDPKDSLFIVHSGDPFPGGTAVAPFAASTDSAGYLNVVLNFNWATGCQHISTTPYNVNYTITDNGCPLPKVKYFNFGIVVKPPPLVNQVNLLCIKFLTDSIIQVYFGDTNSIADKFFKHFIIYRSDNGSPFTTIGTISQTGLNYFTDSTAYNAKTINYCYYLVGVNSCDFSGPPSDTLCTLDALNQKLNYIATTTVNAENEIKVEWQHFPDGPFSTFYVFRRDQDSIPPFTLYNTLYNPTTDFTFDNIVRTAEKSYCYYLINEDYCENKSPESNIGCSILLTGKSAPYVNYLNWTAYEHWNGGVATYELWRQNDEKSAFQLLAVLNNNKLSYVDDNLDLTGGRFAYKIIAREGAGSLNASSTSNEVILVQAPQIFIPNAFSPNSDALNETWFPKSTFVNQFELYVFNRWGQKVFESYNETDQWDGRYKGSECQQGVYFYVLKYSGYDKEDVFVKRGSITLVR